MIVNIVVSSYTLSKINKREDYRNDPYDPYDPYEPYDPDPCDPKYKSYFDERYDWCMANIKQDPDYCNYWAPKCTR